jgi:hypothetical protein
MKRIALTLAVVAVVSMGSTLVAADNPTGTWKWTTNFGGQSRDATLKLKLDGEKLSGTYVGRDSETPIENATFNDDTVSFSVTRERDGQKFTTKYSGKLSGDTITGKSERQRDGQTQASDWVAKRQK